MAELAKEIWDALYENYLVVAPYLTPFTNIYYTLLTNSWPFLGPFLNRLAESAHELPPFVAVGLFLIFALIVLQILLYIQSIMSVVTRWIRNGLLVGALVVVGSVVYRRGLDKTWLELRGGWNDVSTVWLRFYEGYQKAAGANPQTSAADHLVSWWRMRSQR